MYIIYGFISLFLIYGFLYAFIDPLTVLRALKKQKN
jgi:hypothetical protein